MKEYAKFICAGLVGVLLGSTLFGFLFDLLFTHWVATESTKFGNWAMWTGAFFTAVAAGAAIYAAYGAVRTLNFLKGQDAAARAHDQKRFAHDEAIWNEQRVMLKFQQFREHKADFDAMLSKLEKTYPIRFNDRLSLYKKVFPNNSHRETTYQVVFDEQQESILPDLNDIMSSIVKVLSEFSVITDYGYASHLKLMENSEKHLKQISRLLSDLDITLEINNSYGDLFVNNSALREQVVLLNIFDAYQSTKALNHVVDCLMDFCGCKPIGINSSYNSWGYNYAIANYAMAQTNGFARTKDHAFNRNLTSLFEYYKFTRSSVYSSNRHIKVFHTQFHEFLSNADLRYTTTTAPEVIIDIFEKAISSTILFNKDQKDEVPAFYEKLTAFRNQTNLLRENARAGIDF